MITRLQREGKSAAQGTAYDQIVDALRSQGKKVRESRPGQAMAQCPAHEDRDPSLSIRRFPQRTRVKCFAGCTDDQIMAALNLRCPNDLFDNPKGATYPYADGWTQHWPPNKKIWGKGPKTNGQPTPLYRLDEVTAAKEAGKIIYLVEGEPDADAIYEEGAVGTTGRGGADSFHLADVTPLHGAKIVAGVDRPTKDGDKSGETWARQVREALGGKAASLDFVQARIGKDISDHLTAQLGLDELVPYAFPPNPLLARKRNGAWLDAQIFGPLQWVVPEIVPEGWTLLVGAPKIGKSWLALAIALAVASGGYMFGKIYCGNPRPVLLLALEDSDRRLQSRIRELIPGESIPELLDYFTDINPSEVVPVIEAWLEDLPADAKPLVIIDTIGKILPQALMGESQYQRDYRFSSRLQAICRKRPGMAQIGLHHDRKASTDDFVESISGTNGLAGAADTILVIQRPRNESEGLLKITGRDVEENEYGIKLIEGSWSLLGDNLREATKAARTVHATVGLGDRSAEIVEFVADHPEGVRAADVAETLALTPDDAGKYLRRLYESGRIRKAKRGLYTPVSDVRSVRTDPETDTPPTTDRGYVNAHAREQPAADQVETEIAKAMAADDWPRVAQLESLLNEALGQ